MATREIKTTIALDGEQKFKQAISAATREMRVMQSELNAVSAAYSANGNAASYYAAKQSNLKGQIDQQKQIISALENAVREAADAYGEGSSQVDGYTIKLNNARTKMSQLEKQLQETDREMEELGRDSSRAGKQLEDGLGDSAQETKEDIEDMYDALAEGSKSISISSGISAVKDAWDMASGVFSGVSDFASETRELRTQLAFLEQNAQAKNIDFGWLTDEMTEVAGIVGNTQEAISGLSGLLMTGMDASGIEAVSDAFLGARIRFGEQFTYTGLSESFGETMASGQATGQFAELLTVLKVDVEAFNTALANSNTLLGDQQIALAYLAEAGLADAAEGYRQANEELVEANERATEMELELATLGGYVDTYIVQPVQGVALEFLKWVNEGLAKIEQKGKEFEDKQAQQTALAEETGYAGTMEVDPFGLSEEPVYVEPPKSDYDLYIAQKEAEIAELNAKTEEARQTLAEAQAAGLIDRREAAALRSELSDPMSESAQKAIEKIERLEERMKESTKTMEEYGTEAGTAATDAFGDAISGLSSEAYDAGADAGMRYAMGIMARIPAVSSAASALGAAAAAGLGSGRGAGVTTRGSTTLTFNVDGYTFAQATLPYYDAAQGGLVTPTVT